MVTNRTVLPPETGRVVDSVTDPEPPEASDDPYIDLDLPSLDSDAARLVEHSAWPWVCWDGVGGDGVEVDYTGLSMG